MGEPDEEKREFADHLFHAWYTDKPPPQEENEYEYRRFILDQPEMKAILSDYLQELLYQKPDKVVPFTKEYFQRFQVTRATSNGPDTSSDEQTSSHNFGSGKFSIVAESLIEGVGVETFTNVDPDPSLDYQGEQAKEASEKAPDEPVEEDEASSVGDAFEPGSFDGDARSDSGQSGYSGGQSRNSVQSRKNSGTSDV